MDLVLKRGSGVTIRDQIRYQLEIKILTGELLPAQRLPSVRALARRLDVHANTIAAAYKDLEATGHVRARKGAGLFVRPSPTPPPAPASLDELLRGALRQAFHWGYSVPDVRSALERWLATAQNARVAVVDPSREMSEVLAEELRQATGVGVASYGLMEVEERPGLLSGALALTLPYHVDTLAALSAAEAVEPVSITIPPDVICKIQELSAGSTLLVVSHAPTMLPFAEVYLKSLVGEALTVTSRPLSATREWRQLLSIADLVVADVLAARSVSAVRSNRMIEVRLLSAESVKRLRPLLMARQLTSEEEDLRASRAGGPIALK